MGEAGNERSIIREEEPCFLLNYKLSHANATELERISINLIRLCDLSNVLYIFLHQWIC